MIPPVPSFYIPVVLYSWEDDKVYVYIYVYVYVYVYTSEVGIPLMSSANR